LNENKKDLMRARVSVPMKSIEANMGEYLELYREVLR
jgi:hypothetical protein